MDIITRATLAATPTCARRDDERGMATAEYAVATLAAITFAGVLIGIFSDAAIRKLLLDIIIWILQHIMKM